MPTDNEQKNRELYQFMASKKLLDTTQTSYDIFNRDILSNSQGRKDIYDVLSANKSLGNIPYEEFDADYGNKNLSKPVAEPAIPQDKETSPNYLSAIRMGAYRTNVDPIFDYFFGTPIGTVAASVAQQPGSIAVTAPNVAKSYLLSVADANAKLAAKSNTDSWAGEKMVINDALETGLRWGKGLFNLISTDNSDVKTVNKATEQPIKNLQKSNEQLFNKLTPESQKGIKSIEKKQLENYATITDINKVFNTPFDTYKGEHKGSFWLDQVPGGMSQTSIFVLMGYLAGSLGASPITGTMLTGAMAESGGQIPDAWNAIKDKKLTDTEKSRIMGQTNLASAVTGTTEALPIEAQLESIGKLGATMFKNISEKGLIQKALSKDGIKAFGQYVKTGMVGGGEEFLQEGLQTGLENYTAKDLYDTSREISDGMFESAAVGGISGLVLSMFGLGVSIRAQKTQNAEDKVLLEKASNLIHQTLQKTETKLQSDETEMVNVQNDITNRINILYPQVDPNVQQELKPVTYQDLSNGDEELTKELREFVENYQIPKSEVSTIKISNWFDDEVFKVKQESPDLTPDQAREQVYSKFLNEYARTGIPGTSVTPQQIQNALHGIIATKAIVDLGELNSPSRPIVEADVYDEKKVQPSEVFNEESVNKLKTEFTKLAEAKEPFKITYQSNTTGLSERLIRNVTYSQDGTQAYAEQYNAKEDLWEKRTYSFDNRLKSVGDVQSTTKENIVPPAVSNAVSGQSIAVPQTISGFMDKVIKRSEGIDKVKGILARQIKEKAGDLQVRVVDSKFIRADGTSIQDSKASLVVADINDKRTTTVYINSDFIDGDSILDSTLHEGFHFILREFLNPSSVLYNGDFALKLSKLTDQFYNEIKDLDIYENNKEDFDRIFTLKDKSRRAEEFMVHLLSGTSPTLTALSKDTQLKNVKNPTSVWQQFVKYITDAWERMFGKEMSYYDGINSLLSKYTTIKTEDTFWDSDAIRRNGEDAIGSDDLSDSEMFSNEAQSGEIDVKSLTVIGKILSQEEDFHTLDYISYIQTLSKDRLGSRLKENKEWNDKVENYYNFKYADKKKVTLGRYKDHLVTSIWENAQQKKKYNTVRLTVVNKYNIKTKTFDKTYTVNEFTGDYRDNKGAWKDGYHAKTRLDERVKQFSNLFGTDLELIYLDQVYEVNENEKVQKTWKINSTNGLVENRNGLISTELAKAGYLFLGTFSDKQTVVAFKLKDKSKENNAKVIEKLNEFRQLYSDNAQKCADALGYNEEQKQQFAAGYDEVSNSNLTRLILEDMKYGGQQTQEGWKSALYNPKIKDTYDIVKILKRSVETAPLGATYIDKEENTKFVENLKKTGKSFGISVNEKTGDIDLKSVIFNSETADFWFTVNIAGREFKANMKTLLKNRMGTETTDGIIVWSEGTKETYSWKHSTIKDGPVKAWGGNLLGEDFNDPLYLKASWQKTNSDPLTQWMKENNISVLISDTSAKINTRYSEVDLLGAVDTKEEMKSFQIPLSAINKDKEKGELVHDAKGLAQSFTSNLMASANGFFVDKGVNEAVDFLLNRLSDEVQNTMIELSPEAILGYVIERAYNSSSTVEADKAQTLLKFFIGKDFYEAVAKEINAHGKSALNNYTKLRELGNTSFAALYEPMFKDIYERFVTNAASKIYNFKAPASWTVISTDFGWLESDNIKKIYQSYLNNGIPLTDLQIKRQKVQDELDFYAERTSDAKDESDLDEILKHTNKLHKKLTIIDKQIASLQKVEDELTPEEKDARSKEAWDKTFGVIDIETGRLKEGWGYLEESYKEAFNLEQGDKFIATAVPSDGMTSQQAVKIAAFINGKDENIAILNSEHTQTIVGKDFDIDTMHLLFRDGRHFTFDSYDKLWETISESNKKYYSDVVSVYKKILKNVVVRDNNGDPIALDFNSVHSKPVQLAFMQTLFKTPESSNKIFSLAKDLEAMNNKFAKDIGAVINQRKIFTTILQLGVSSKIKIDGKSIAIGDLTDSEIEIAYLMLMRLTNDRVDSPTNDNLLHYNFNDIIFYNLLHGTKFDSANENDINYVNGLNLAERFLFYYGNKITTEKNLDNRDDDYTLKEMTEYVAKQQQINKVLDSKDRRQLLQIFDEWLKGFKKPDSIIYDTAKAYLGGIDIKNSTDKSFAMNAINRFELQNIPNVELSQPVYAKWKYETLNSILSSKNVLSPEFYKLLSDAKEEYAHRREGTPSSLFSDVDDIKVKNRNIYSPELQNVQAITVASYPTALWMKNKESKIKDLQWTAIDFMYPRAQSMADNRLSYLKDWQILANKIVYPKLMDKLLEADVPVFIKEHKGVIPPKFVTFKYDSRTITLTNVNNTTLSIHAVGKSGVEFHWNTLEDFNTTLIEEGNFRADKDNKTPQKIATTILGMFTSKDGILSDFNNRNLLSSFINFSASIPFASKLESTVEYLKENINSLSEGEQEMLWTSLMAFPSTVDLKNAMSLVKQNKEKLYSQSLTFSVMSNFPSGIKYMRSIAPMMTEAFKGLHTIGIGSYVNIKNVLNRTWFGGDTIEIWDELNKEVPKEVPESLLSKLKDTQDIVSVTEHDKAAKIYQSYKDIVMRTIELVKDNEVTRGLTVENSVQSMESFDYTDIIKKGNLLLETTPSMDANAVIVDIKKQLNTILGIHRLGIQNIENLLSEVAPGNKQDRDKIREETLVKAVESLEDGQEEINRVSIGKKGREYAYTLDGIEYSYSGLKERLKNIPDLNAKLIGLEYRKGDFNNRKIADKMVGYLQYIKQNDENLQWDHLYNPLLKEWIGIQSSFNSMNNIYFPHVFEKDVLHQIFTEELKRKYPTLSDEVIKEIVDKKILKMQMRSGNFGDRVYMFLEKRVTNDGRYIKNSTSPFVDHQTMFYNKVRDDLHLIHMSTYEQEARLRGSSEDVIQKMKTIFQMSSSGSKPFRRRTVSVNGLKKEDRVTFYKLVEGVPTKVEGTFDHIKNGRVFFEINKEAVEKYTINALTVVERENSKVQRDMLVGDRSFPYDRYYEGLVKEGYLERKDYSTLSIGEYLDDITKGLKDKLADKTNWGSLTINEVSAKKYSNIAIRDFPGYVDVYEGEKVLNPSINRARAILHTLVLGSPLGFIKYKGIYKFSPAAFNNYTDSLNGLIRTLGIWNYAQIVNRKSKDNSIVKAKHILNKTEEEITKSLVLLDKSAEENANLLQTEKGQNDLIIAHVIEYMLEFDLLGAKPGEANQRMMDKIMAMKGKNKQRAFDKLLHDISGIATTGFSNMEIENRIRSAYAFAYQAIVLKGFTDSERIKLTIQLGVDMTQSAYDMNDRKLMEKSEWGKLLYQYAQYPHFQRRVWKSLLKTRKIAGETLDDISKENTVTHLLGRQLLFDATIGAAAQVIFPGVRMGNPVTRPYLAGLGLALNFLLLSSDPDEDDWRNFILSLITFRVGLGLTMPLMLLWNVLWRKTSISDLIPLHPKMLTSTLQVAAGLYESMGKVDRSNWDKTQHTVEVLRATEKLLEGNNIITGGYNSPYLSNKENYHKTLSIFEKVAEPLTHPVNTFESIAPPFNLLKDFVVSQ